MEWSHTALTCRSEEMADLFYRDVLGLDKQAPKTAPRKLCRELFGIDRELRVINYLGESIRFEIFILAADPARMNKPDHVCLIVTDRQKLLDRCRQRKIDVLCVTKGEKKLVFIQDPAGHLFEIQE